MLNVSRYIIPLNNRDAPSLIIKQVQLPCWVDERSQADRGVTCLVASEVKSVYSDFTGSLAAPPVLLISQGEKYD